MIIYCTVLPKNTKYWAWLVFKVFIYTWLIVLIYSCDVIYDYITIGDALASISQNFTFLKFLASLDVPCTLYVCYATVQIDFLTVSYITKVFLITLVN